MTDVEGGLDEPAELEPAQGALALAGPGDAATAADWEAQAAAVLRKTRALGAEDPDSAVWDALTRTTLDGVAVTPLGRAADLEAVRSTGRPTRAGAWDVRAHLGVLDAAADREAALADLEGGCTSLWLTAAAGADLAALLEPVFLDLAPVVLEATDDQEALAAALLAHLEDRALQAHPGTNLGADPVGLALRAAAGAGGRAALDADPDLGPVVRLARAARDAGVLGVVVDGTVLHDLGASDAQELGYVVALGAAYLRALVDDGLGVDEAAALVELRLAATDEQFPTIAKLRAVRRLWGRVLEVSGASQADDGTWPVRVHAVTSRPMLAAYDPWTNMLRTTVAAFAAGVGGAEAVTVLPFDAPLGRPEAFGRRIARNVSHLLVEESHVAAVTDPAGGAYAVERLTDDLAHVAWEEVGRLEEAGGVVAALRDGSLADRVADVVARREDQVARRERAVTGLSEFPQVGEELPARDEDPLAPPVRRWGAAYEELRAEPRGTVFLASMGPVAAHTARVTFAANLFAAGGVAVHQPGPLLDVDAAVAAYDGQPVVCLAGTDAAYAEWGPALVTALRDAGARRVVVAGRPQVKGPDGDRVDLGVDDGAAMGVDALAFLARTREVLS